VSWGQVVYRHRREVIWLVVLIIALAGWWGLGVFDRLSEGGYDDPGSESAHVAKIVEQALGRHGGDVVVVYTTPEGTTVDTPAIAGKITRSLNALPRDAVKDVVSYWSTRRPWFTDAGRRHAVALVDLAGSGSNEQLRNYTEIQDKLPVDGVRTQASGAVPTAKAMSDRGKSDLGRSEAVSLPIVLALLVVVFGGLVAASIPVAVGGLSIMGATGVMRLLSEWVDVNSFAVNVASLLGLGLAIDYGLFMVGRFREELAVTDDIERAVCRTVRTAGRTVGFSATMLVIALSGLLLFPQDFLKSLAYGGIAAVSIAALVSLSLLPAVLGALGSRVDALALPWPRRQVNAASRHEDSGWTRLAAAVMRRPWLVVAPIVIVLALLGALGAGVRFEQPDEKALPADDPVRQATEVLNQDFPGLSGGAMEIVLRGRAGAMPGKDAVRQFTTEVGGVAGVRQAAVAGSSGDVVVIDAQLSGDAYDAQATQAVRDVRGSHRPAGTEALVGGLTAQNVDSLDSAMARLPWVIMIVVGATLLVMFLAFGSVLLPIKAVVVSALSLSATFGVMVWVFQEGNGATLLGVTPAPLIYGVVVLMAALIFGLSTDYEAFLLSRMVEARAGGASTECAVMAGVASTGRVITAAALLLIVVTGAFAVSEISLMRFIGVGMILALALDATVVRLLLVPAVIKLLGTAAWWAPGWSRPRRRVESESA
jgi:trehalose monomycolate/heme transporter